MRRRTWKAFSAECPERRYLEDFERLREDGGLREMLGHEVPSPEAARKFLYQFHDERQIERAQAELPVGQVSYIPAESEALRGLATANWYARSGGDVQSSGWRPSVRMGR